MEIQQSKPYASYIRSLGWTVITHDRHYYFLKKLPFIGGLLKIQRVTRLPNVSDIRSIVLTHHVTRLVIEPDRRIPQSALTTWANKVSSFVHIASHDHFLQTKSIRVDVTADVATIFNHFSEAKRRAVRRAEKNGVHIEVSSDIRAFIKLKQTAAGFLGFITTFGLDKLWQQFAPQTGDILLAKSQTNTVIGGILLLYWHGVAYYWVAGATKEGKKLFAPTLLVWAALQQAKKHGTNCLDFVGVWDEREPTQNHEWKGFTKFKEGFGGYELYYPIV